MCCVRSEIAKEELEMKVPSRTMSRPGSIVCPGCGRGELGARRPDPAGCDSCGHAVDETMLETLLQIVSLPDALGAHACEECGHPEMRRLPGGVFHCPACRSEVVPARPEP